MDWIHMEVGLPDHPKIGRLSRRLKVDRDRALAIVVRLLCWTATAKEDGHLNGTEPEDIAEVCRYHGDPQALVEALVGAGWIDQDDSGLTVHDWMERQGRMLRARERERNRRAENAVPHAAPRCATLPHAAGRGEERRREEKPPLPPLQGGTPSRLRNLSDNTVVSHFDEARAALRSDPSNPKAQETFDKLAAEITRRGLK
jgi:hypothetical protein